MDSQKLVILSVTDDAKLHDKLAGCLQPADGVEFDVLHCAHAEAARLVLGQRKINVVLVNNRAKPGALLENLKCLLRADHFAGAVIAVPSAGNEDLATETMKAGAADYINAAAVTRARLLGAVLAAHQKAALRAQVDSRRRELERYARFDELTGLQNERSLRDALLQEMWRARRYSDPLSLLLLDIDRLEDVKSGHGATMGDVIVSTAGRVIKENARSTDLAGRRASNDFCVILTATDLKGAKIFGNRLRKRLGGMVFMDSKAKPFQITCSVGIAELKKDLSDSVSFFARADQALFHAKKLGCNRLCVAKPGKNAA